MLVGTLSTHISLLERLAEGGDEAAWREFCDRYGELIYSFAQRRGLQSADCDEIGQEVKMALARSMPGFRYDPAKGKFRSYLKAVTERTVTRQLCKKRGEVSLEEVETATKMAIGDAVVEDAWELEWRQYHVRRAMVTIRAEFNKRDVAAFEAYAFEGRDAEEVAAAQGMSVGHVYTLKSRIMTRLSELVRQQVEEEG